ncbi:acyl-CoA dehydrogenase family protein [Nocardia camponoti]|uniref:Acyl-CoA dehydrogenase n=1 Tax=Nocardia camponoti TaxID=1616106 RepID=A0A917QFS7_9NOCA|nr:acyl-CoA dehydrogenase family protein [Nocardia camponoti]GGK46832.1 acyl-CoA dehydrogenase [Nocardia camponoti]
MDLELTEEQTMLRDTVRELLHRFYDGEALVQVTSNTDHAFNPAAWKQLADLGVLGLTISEEDGGVGAGVEEAMLVQGELGRALAPEPVLDAVVIPAELIKAAASAEQRARLLPSLADGTKLMAFAHAEPGIRWPSTEITTTATPQGDGFVLAGVKNPVLRGDVADEVIVSAVLPDGTVGLFLVAADAAGVRRQSYRTFDGRRGAQFNFEQAVAEPLGSNADAASVIAAALNYAQVALSVESVGALETTLAFTVEYLKTRKQFGVTLSKFQVLTQRAADLYVALEIARSISLYATASLAEGALDPVVASRTRLQVGEAATYIGQEAIQLHGGIGVTAEYPVSHYVARLTAIGQTLGGTHEHRRVLAERVGSYDLAEL